MNKRSANIRTSLSHLPDCDRVDLNKRVCRNWHLEIVSGCRGFIGPVPLPLWIRVGGRVTEYRVLGQAGIDEIPMPDQSRNEGATSKRYWQIRV